MDTLLQNLRFALRIFRTSPVFGVTAIVTIALGIGASTAIFSVTNAILLQPLPFSNPDRLVLACGDMQKRDVVDYPFSSPDFMDLRNGATKMFEDFAAVSTLRGFIYKEDGTPEPIRTAGVTPNFFRLLGVKIAVGRDFTDADGHPPAPQPQLGAQKTQPPLGLPTIGILSYEYWQRRYGGSTAILGRNLPAGGPQIVGVLAPGFELLFPPSANIERTPDVWYARRLTYDNLQRNTMTLRVIGRLRAGVSLSRAQSETETVTAELRKNIPLREASGFHIRLDPMKRHLTAEVRPTVLALMGAAIFLMLIACANVANLLFVRTLLRDREMAVRATLGAGWKRLTAQLLTEALLLAALGTLLGCGLAWIGIRELLAIAPANLPRLESINIIDPTVLAFSVIAGLAAAAVFGIAPAWHAVRTDAASALRAGGRSAGPHGGRILRSSVVIVEVALSFVLLIGSGLMFRSFLALQSVNPGYDPRGLLTFQLLGSPGTGPEQRAAYMRNVHDKLRTLPGVEGVTAAWPFPLTGGFYPIRWGTAEALSDPSKFQSVDYQVVLPGYFETMHTPIISGRAFAEEDNVPEPKRVIIDQILAVKAFKNESALGKRILTRLGSQDPQWVEVIGVAAHQRASSLTEVGREQIYFADGFLGYGNPNRWAVRTSGESSAYSAQIRAEIAKINKNLLVTEFEPMSGLVAKARAGTRFSLLLIGVFAVVAALLAAVGLYGVLSTVVRERTAEIGVRMALGAEPGNIFKLVVGYGLRLSLVGILSGICASYYLTRLIISMLVQVQATDPTTFGAMTALFLLLTVLACWLPARRAANLNPNVSLREE
jgi:predicted permease